MIYQNREKKNTVDVQKMTHFLQFLGGKTKKSCFTPNIEQVPQNCERFFLSFAELVRENAFFKRIYACRSDSTKSPFFILPSKSNTNLIKPHYLQ